MKIHLVYLTYRTVCDRLYEYRDTELATLTIFLKSPFRLSSKEFLGQALGVLMCLFMAASSAG